MIINKLLTIRSLLDRSENEKIMIMKKYVPTYTHSMIIKVNFCSLKWGLTILSTN